MAFEIKKTEIEGLVFIKPFISEDARGYYKKVFEREIFDIKGLATQYFEFSYIQSKRGAIRGLHYQDKHSQGKLIHVLKGKIYDVALDLRPESKTFGYWHSATLCDNEHISMFVPAGFAHGFMALEDDTIFAYQCTNYYEPESCGGILWSDPALNIPWPIKDNIVITEKDKRWPTLAEFCKLRGIEQADHND